MRNHHRRRSIAATALAASFLLGACGEKPRPGTPPEYLVLVTVEGLRADHVTANGYSRETTLTRKEGIPKPHDLDAVIDAGVSFANAFAPTGRLRPAVISLMTGRSPLAHGVLEDGGTLAGSIPTLAERFKDAGFVTGAFLSPSRSLIGSGVERGFDTFEESDRDAQVVKGTVEWLRERIQGGVGFFLWVHLGTIAPPFTGDPLVDRFSELEYEGPLTGDSDFLADWASGAITDEPAHRARLIDLYDGRVLDVGHLLDAFFWYYDREFSEAGWWDRTLFVVAGTSGMELAERGGPNGPIGNARSLVDAGLRVPLALRHPWSLTGQRILDEVVELADVAPTVGDWFHFAGDDGATGRSLLALTDSYVEREFPHRPALALDLEGGRVRGSSLRTRGWRAIFTDGEPQLFRVDADPRALHDVAARHPEVVAEMAELLPVFEP